MASRQTQMLVDRFIKSGSDEIIYAIFCFTNTWSFLPPNISYNFVNLYFDYYFVTYHRDKPLLWLENICEVSNLLKMTPGVTLNEDANIWNLSQNVRLASRDLMHIKYEKYFKHVVPFFIMVKSVTHPHVKKMDALVMIVDVHLIQKYHHFLKKKRVILLKHLPWVFYHYTIKYMIK
jgi:hypothetical protein